MPTTFTWNITNLEREIADEYVYIAYYTVCAKDDYSVNAYGSVWLERPNNKLIPYSNLTEEIVVNWVKNKLGIDKVTEIEVALQNQLNEQRNPTRADGLPWS